MDVENQAGRSNQQQQQMEKRLVDGRIDAFFAAPSRRPDPDDLEPGSELDEEEMDQDSQPGSQPGSPPLPPRRLTAEHRSLTRRAPR